MSVDAIIGVDIGTSSSKGVLVTLDGTVLRSESRTHSPSRPRAGWVEMDADLWWHEFAGISRELAGTDDVDIVAVGVSGMGPCVLVTDAGGLPLRPAILYGIDTRATAQIAALTERLGGDDAIMARTGSALSTQAVGPKLAWLADNEPEVFAHARRLFMPASWLAWNLTGAYVLDHHSASQCTPLYDASSHTWYEPWAEPIAGRIDLPPLCWPGDVAGRVTDAAANETGLPTGIPVIAGTIDAWSEAVSVGAQHPGDLMLMYGTTMFLVNTVPQPLTAVGLWGTVGAFPGTHNLAGGMATSGAIAGWLRDLFGVWDFPELLALAAASGPGARGLLMLPYFAGERTPIQDPNARGVIAGLTVSHSQGDLYRAALEATAFGVRHNIEAMRDAGGLIERIVAVGGGAQGSLWTQIVSDVTGLPQVIPTITIGASFGAAFLAALTVRDADIDRWNPPAEIRTPDAQATQDYDELYELYRALYPATREVSHALAARQDRQLLSTCSTPSRSTTESDTRMTSYTLPVPLSQASLPARTIFTVASGDLRQAANLKCWPTQHQLEANFSAAVNGFGWSVQRGHDADAPRGHGFIDSQRMGIEVFKTIPVDAPVVVVEAVWQYSHHVLAGLRSHVGPILVVANWAGDFPGLVGLLNLTASLTKAGVRYSSLWSKDFTDDWATAQLRTWLETGRIEPDESHVRDLPALDEGSAEVELGIALALQLQQEKAIIGIFDEGCMGMYNAIIDDELLNPLGIYKERLSQSALFAEMGRVSDEEANEVRSWLDAAGFTFHFGEDEATELTAAQVHSQFKMYIAAVRISDDYGLDAVGIQYQQGLKDLVPASDLAEGLLNNVERPPVFSRDGSRELYAGAALPHFNEVDEGVAVDALVTNRVWTAMGLDPANTLHDVRWGEEYAGEFVWVFEISGSVPASHNGGYDKSYSMRQPSMFFPLGGGTLSGVSKPGEIVWSRVFIMDQVLHVDLGRGHVADLPAEETQRRLDATDPQWPIMHAVLNGVSRNQLMGRHKANHAQVVYAPDAATADRALLAKAAAFHELGVIVHLCGEVAI